MCVSELTIIGSDKGFSPGRRQAIISNNAGLELLEQTSVGFKSKFIYFHLNTFKKVAR